MAKEQRRIYMDLVEIKKDIESVNNYGYGPSKSSLKAQKEVLQEHHLNFYEHLAILVNEGKLNEKLAKSYFKDTLVNVYDNYAEKIREEYPEIEKLRCRWIVNELPESHRISEEGREIFRQFFIGLIIGYIIGRYALATLHF